MLNTGGGCIVMSTNYDVPLHIRVPNRLLLDKTVTNSAIFTYFALSLYRNNEMQQAYPGQNTLAKRFSKSQQFFSKAIKELCEKDYITVTKRYTKGGAHFNNVYTFADKCEKGYTIILHDIIEKLMLSADLLVYYAKIKRFVYNETLEMIYTTKTEISELMGVNSKTVDKLLQKLEDKELITVKQNINKRCIDVKLEYEDRVRDWYGENSLW